MKMMDEPATDHPPRRSYADRGYLLIERLLLIIAAAMTLIAAGHEIWSVWETGRVALADILLMFLYTEVIGMIAVFHAGNRAFFIYPIFIAITALARLVVLQGKDMAPENLMFEAGAILLLSIAALILGRSRID
ncbi:MAG: phosphate-starvation-inducible E [Porphyrobacter sp.]|nr:phosphate-starvation-inducible E [Porphyrobacter sp.]